MFKYQILTVDWFVDLEEWKWCQMCPIILIWIRNIMFFLLRVLSILQQVATKFPEKYFTILWRIFSNFILFSKGEVTYHTNKIPGDNLVTFSEITTTSAPTTTATMTTKSCTTCKHSFDLADFVIGIRKKIIDFLMCFKKYV